jgi:hypothetical protein
VTLRDMLLPFVGKLDGGRQVWAGNPDHVRRRSGAAERAGGQPDQDDGRQQVHGAE